MLIKEAVKHTHSLSETSKMPGKSIGISAFDCNIGMKLAKVEGTVCEECYAFRNFYLMPTTKIAHDKRLQLMLEDPLWEDAMTVQVRILKMPYFRWVDSGDLQAVYNLERIVRVCERTPSIHHWLPTKEYQLVAEFLLKGGKIPENLSLRLSGYKFDDPPPKFRYGHVLSQLQTSTATHLDEDEQPVAVHGHLCPAHWQKGECGDCRACWNKEVPNVTYVDQRQKIKEA